MVAGLIVAGGILFAFSLDSVVQGLEVFWKISAMMGLAFWVGLFWRRATVAGAWAGTLVGFAVFLFTSSISVLDQDLWVLQRQTFGWVGHLEAAGPEHIAVGTIHVVKIDGRDENSCHHACPKG